VFSNVTLANTIAMQDIINKFIFNVHLCIAALRENENTSSVIDQIIYL